MPFETPSRNLSDGFVNTNASTARIDVRRSPNSAVLHNTPLEIENYTAGALTNCKYLEILVSNGLSPNWQYSRVHVRNVRLRGGRRTIAGLHLDGIRIGNNNALNATDVPVVVENIDIADMFGVVPLLIADFNAGDILLRSVRITNCEIQKGDLTSYSPKAYYGVQMKFVTTRCGVITIQDSPGLRVDITGPGPFKVRRVNSPGCMVGGNVQWMPDDQTTTPTPTPDPVPTPTPTPTPDDDVAAIRRWRAWEARYAARIALAEDVQALRTRVDNLEGAAVAAARELARLSSDVRAGVTTAEQTAARLSELVRVLSATAQV